jgi:hypothetical protein
MRKKVNLPIEITENDYRNLALDHPGFCQSCREILDEASCEPDAINYTCELCEQNTLMGLDYAILLGYVNVVPHVA